MVTLAALVLPALAAAGADERAAKVLAALRANLAPLKTLTAEVSVETVIQRVWTEQVYRQHYRYAFAKPSSVRLEFIRPSGQVVIARGRTVWVNGKKTQGAGTGSEDAASPLSLMRLSLDPEGIAREYAITSFAEPARPALTGLNLVPGGGSGPITAVRVWADAARGVVDETKVFGAEQALLSTSVVKRFERVGPVLLPAEIVTYGCEGRCRTTITFADVKLNPRLPAGLFTPEAPAATPAR